MHDIIIVGGGPAGLTAAVYALRAGKSVLVIEKAGFGIAVQNADKGLKAKAKTVSPLTNEEGAVAWAIEQFGFQK